MGERKWTAANVRAALELRHPEEEGEWIVLHECLAIDTLAIRTWQGRRGCLRIAYEVKVSVADFRREIERPEKRRLACEIAHAFVFAMPWELAWKVRGEVPLDLGIVGIVNDGRGYYVARDVRTVDSRPPRPLSDSEVAHLIRHRANPPALRHALLERQERNQQIRRLRDERDRSRSAAVELALPLLKPGVLFAPEWSTRVLTVTAVERKGDGGATVRLLDRLGYDREYDLGEMLSNGYRIREEAAPVAADTAA